MNLGDLGAEVVKVEQPGIGDETRGWGPPFVGDDAAYFLCLNRNKRSVALDLASDRGRRAARALATRSDVLVENFRPGLMRRFGLDYENLREENPRLVYCSITAFRPDTEADRPGYDIIMQAISGLMSMTGLKGGEPVKVGVALLDVVVGLYATVGILAALRHRERTGEGQLLSLSLFDASVAALVNQAANYLLGGLVPGPMGTEHPNILPYQVFPAADRPFVVAAANDRLFRRTCRVVGRPDLADDPRFRTNEGRVRNRDDLVSMLTATFRERPAGEWLERLEAEGVPCAPVRALDEVFASPDGAGLIEEIEDPARGRLRLVASPLRLSATPPLTRQPPPRLGEHTEQILEEG
jgi:crotonobetainyl-CoA:carnitine CoA-transferase CaiB-like acyl-CoA transferase